MILVDTSVWIDHLRNGNADLQALLQESEVLVHPFVIGELACGTLGNRAEVLRLLQELPRALLAEDAEVLNLLETYRLWGRGVGWIDVHLLASTLLSHSRIWTLDKHLSGLASAMKLQK